MCQKYLIEESGETAFKACEKRHVCIVGQHCLDFYFRKKKGAPRRPPCTTRSRPGGSDPSPGERLEGGGGEPVGMIDEK